VERNLSARIIGSNDLNLLQEEGRIRAVVVSTMPPEAVTVARSTCKRIRAVTSRMPIFVGLWGGVGDLERAQQRLTTAGSTYTVTSFAECFDLVEGVVGPRESPAAELEKQLDPARP